MNRQPDPAPDSRTNDSRTNDSRTNDSRIPAGPTASGPTSSGPRDAAGAVEGVRSGGGGSLSMITGGVASGVFYAVVYVVPWPPLQRYFLGHPVAVVSTIMFFVALAILAGKWRRTSAEWRGFHRLRDEDLTPPRGDAGDSPADRYRDSHDVRHVARRWIDVLSQLPKSACRNPLVIRLQEVLQRQHSRGNTQHLSDDLRELSGRDADASHDSFGLVRIIVWAIPMLGFLGTVVGITQTLGGLDFTDGAAAVDRLKSGLYVAFDTTALGLVLSVVAIFLQFPVERSEQALLSAIDTRIGPLLSAGLPVDDATDDPAQLIVALCDGIRVAVAESLANQTTLWRTTIDEANQHWQNVHHSDANQFTTAIERALIPALKEHAAVMDESVRFAGDRLERNAQQWQGTLESSFDRMLIGQQATIAGQQMLTDHQRRLIDRAEQLGALQEQIQTLQAAQKLLDSNLVRLAETNRQIDQTIDAAAGHGMADAMRVLARAVDVLSSRMAANEPAGQPAGQSTGQSTGQSAADPRPRSAATRRAA